MKWLVVILSLLWATVATAATNGQNWQFGSATFDPTTFANLGTETDGSLKWCTDCTKTTTCAGGGAGAFAFGQQGAWSCAPPTSSTYPTGSPPQITGFSGVNSPEAETVIGDCTFSRAGANSYVLSCSTGLNFAPSAFCSDLSGFNCTIGAAPFYMDNTGGTGNPFGILYSNGPLSNVAFTGQGVVGSILIGNGAAAPTFAVSPIAWDGTGNAVVPSVSAPSVFAVEGSSTPVATSSEGTVSIVAYNQGTAGAGSSALGAFTCGGYNAAGVISSPSPGSYLFGLRDNRATSTTTCVVTNASSCFSAVLHAIANAHQYDYIAVPSDNANCTANGVPFGCCTGAGTGTCSDPTALIPKCTVKLY